MKRAVTKGTVTVVDGDSSESILWNLQSNSGHFKTTTVELAKSSQNKKYNRLLCRLVV